MRDDSPVKPKSERPSGWPDTARTIGIDEDERRAGSIFHYHLPNGREIVVYPLLYGEARLCTGRIDRDHFERGYDYRTTQEALDAALAWIDTTTEPPGDIIGRKRSQ
jgi:hypothetical protein